MYPEIHIFGIKLYPYGLMIGIGLVSAIYLFMKRCKNRGYDEDHAFDLAMIAAISGILGAKLLFIIVEFPEIIKEPVSLIKDFGNGFVFYGGVIAGVLAGYIYTRVKKWPFFKMFDIAAPSIPLAQAFGRIGCLCAGCCYGKETSSFIGIKFNNSPYAPNGVELIPTQIISSIGNFAIFGILMWFDNRKKSKDGQTGALYLILYSIFRFVVEIFRGDPRGTVFNVLSTSQFICILMFIAGLILLKISNNLKVPETVPAAEGSETVDKAESSDIHDELADVNEVKVTEEILNKEGEK